MAETKISDYDFDLFRLYIPEKDARPRSQIRVKGSNLLDKINSIVTEIEGHGLNINSLCKTISVRLDCHKDTVLKMIRGRNRWISLAVILQILDIYREICKKSSDDIEMMKKDLQESFELFSAGTKSEEYCRVVKRLDKTLAKIVGAHQADGWMRESSNKVSIVDHYKNNLEAFSSWINDLFGIRTKVFKSKKRAWITTVYSKVVGRYIQVFFGFPTGDKTMLPMPDLIKDSAICIKKAYLCGHLTFEGSVELDKTVSLGIKCEMLRDEIYDILKELKLNVSKSEKNGFYHIKSRILTKDDIPKWMELFEENTAKWYKLKDFLDGFTSKPSSFNVAISNLDMIYGEHARSKAPFDNILKTIKYLGMCDRHILAKRLSIGVTTVQSYLKILELGNMIKRRKEGHKLLIEFNPESSEWRIPLRP